MAEAFSLPAGAFQAARTGAPQPSAQPPAPPAKAPKAAEPLKTVTRKAEPPKEVTKPAENVTKPPETPQERKIWKLKADAEEFEFDATDEDAVKREIMKARGADKRFKEAASMKQQSETFLSMLKDPATLKKVLTDPRIGIDLKKFAEDYVWEQIQESQMTPEQKAQRDKDREYESMKAEKDKENLSKAEQAKANRQAQHEANYEKTILKALEVKGVPKDQVTVMKMADYMIAAVQKGYDLSAEEIADMVKNDTGSYLKAYTNAMNEDQLLEFLGDDIAEKIRKADLKKLRSPTSNPFPERYPKKETAGAPLPKKLASKEWRDEVMQGFLARK